MIVAEASVFGDLITGFGRADQYGPCAAAYLALAERLSVSLLTGDAKLSGVPGVRCSFIAVS